MTASLSHHRYCATARDRAQNARGTDLLHFGWDGAPEGIRTPDPQIRSLVLYPAELPARTENDYPPCATNSSAVFMASAGDTRMRFASTSIRMPFVRNILAVSSRERTRILKSAM